MSPALKTAAPRIPAPENLVAIASGKGGVGKTWFSITLAHALARAGQRTLLFDGDLGLANVDVQLGFQPARDLGGVLAGRTTMADAAERYQPGGFDILAGRSGSGSLGTLPGSTLVEIRKELHLLCTNYDRVVLDLGAGIERPVRFLTAQARPCLVVATDEPTSLTDAYAFIKVTASESRGTADLRLVINQAGSVQEGERTYTTLRRACREFLKLDVRLAGIVRYDDKVKESIRRQTSLLTRHPGSAAAEDVEAIARALLLG